MLCSHCNKYFSTKESFLNHSMAFHKFSNKFVCGSINCNRQFASICGLRRHLYICSQKMSSSSGEEVQNLGTIAKPLLQPTSINDLKKDVNENMSEAEGNDDFLKSYVLRFILKLYENKSVTRALVQSITDDVSELFTNLISHLKLKLIPSLENVGDDHSKQIVESFLEENPFLKLKKEYKRQKKFEQNIFFVKPVSYFIGEIRDNTKIGLQIKRCEGQYISIRYVLKQFLELPGVFDEIEKYMNDEKNDLYRISSIFSGTLWNSIEHGDEFKNKMVLPLLIYFDDYETCNPLGTHAGIHKLGAVYFSLPCIPPKFSTRLDNIFLFGLFYSSDRNFHGNYSTFKPFIQELLFLEKEGLIISIKDNLGNNLTHHVHFAVPLVLGDNLGMNSVTGFTESFIAHHFCRICRADKALTQTMFLEDANLLRNVDNYDEDLRAKSCGIKEYCVWNDLSSFHCTSNASCDIMHDLFEGVCRYTLAKVVSYVVFEKCYISFDDLNNRIKYFDYKDSVDIGNRIPLLNIHQVAKGAIIMSSAEMHAFVSYFSLILGDLIDETDEAWACYLLLFEIVRITTKTVTSEDELVYLTSTIYQFLKLYTTIFKCDLKPKFHFLIHYPTIIRRVGTLSNVSSIRFESFHKVAKTNAHIITSRVNIPLTLSVKHQLILSHKFALKIGIQDIIETGPAVCSFEDLKSSSTLDSYINFNLENAVCVKWLKINRVVYKPEYIIPFSFSDDYFEPKFGVIKYILYCDDTTINLIYSDLELYGYVQHFSAYVIKDNNTCYNSTPLCSHIINIRECLLPPVISHLVGNGKKYISAMCIT